MSKSPSLRRIQADVRELALDPSDRYHAAPLEDDMFEWHFTIRGADGTDFEGGIYHGRILLPPEYPFKPPHIVFLTPSGRFEIGTKVCLSFSAYHPELWQPAWGIRLILEALISFLPTPADGAIGALDWTSDERKRLAQKSVSFCCPRCGKAADLLPELKKSSEGDSKPQEQRFAKEIEQLRMLQAAAEGPHKQSEAGSETTEQTSGEAEAKQEKIEEAPSLKEEKQAAQEVETEGAWTDPSAEAPRSEPEAPAIVERPAEETNNEAEPLMMPEPASAQVQPQELAPPAEQTAEVSWLVDPLLNAAIILLAIICYLLQRKLSDLLTELRSLEKP